MIQSHSNHLCSPEAARIVANSLCVSSLNRWQCQSKLAITLNPSTNPHAMLSSVLLCTKEEKLGSGTGTDDDADLDSGSPDLGGGGR
uniref:Uncharacterized protein n=1 Tax=Arundo donax TaxID=35708 RepID=A0A0A9F8V1_ARUDO